MWHHGTSITESIITDFGQSASIAVAEPAGRYHSGWVITRTVVSVPWRILRTVFSIATFCVLLAVLAAIPVVQFLSLGYLLEAAGRLARTGKWSQALPGLDRVAHFGSMLLGVVLFSLLIQLLNNLHADAMLIDPNATSTRVLDRVSAIAGIVFMLHVSLALFRGKLRYFFRPINNLIWLVREWRAGGVLRRRAAQLRAWIKSLRLWHYFSLGFRGFCAAAFWLFIPSTMLAVGKNYPLMGFVGGLLLAVVVCWVPFLQIRFAAENRFGAMFELRTIRNSFRRTPLAYLTVFLLTLALALPLYLLKIEEVPRDAVWMLGLLFIVTILPLKLIAGWAYGRSQRKQTESWRLLSWPCRLLMAPIAIIYTYIVFLTQYTGWHGALAIYEHHAFLLPVPF